MTNGRREKDAASAGTPDVDPILGPGTGPGEQSEIATALADTGAKILHALVAVYDRAVRPKHIRDARRLKSIAYDCGPG